MVDSSVSLALRDLGHDVMRTREIGMSRCDDAGVLQKAIDENRILVSLDEHFGDWVVLPLSAHPGVIRVKADPATSREITAVLLPFLEENSHRQFRNYLVIVRRTGVRWVKTA
jgi:predicted nuclease of predicted toxin-antitoxin system